MPLEIKDTNTLKEIHTKINHTIKIVAMILFINILLFSIIHYVLQIEFKIN